MTLPSIFYGLFLISLVGIYWSLPPTVLRLWVLLVGSIVFYTSLQVQYLPLILALALITFSLGRWLVAPVDWRTPDDQWQFAERAWNRKRQVILAIGIALNVLLLLGFKYYLPILSWVGVPVPADLTDPTITDWWLRVAMPLGISFFSFECIAYLVDVYRGAEPSQRFVEFAAYKLFFPKLISGPITRFHSFYRQWQEQQAPSLNQFVEGLWLIASGCVKKLLIADHIAILVNLSFENLERAGSGDIWLAIAAYGLQLYLDFSGYVDIARGSAILLGFNLPQNFDFPYLATSLADFWRRWHISLGAWLRNYLYFPLGGSRRGLIRTCFNLLVVMLIAGVWHGDNWGFLIWGGIHGLGLAIHRINQSLANRLSWIGGWWASWPGIVVAWLTTQFLVFGSWLFFRLSAPDQFMLALQRIWLTNADVQFAQKVYVESLGLSRSGITIILAGLMALMGLAYTVQHGLKLQLSWPLKLLLIPLCLFLAWILAPGEALPYIYFEF